MGEETLTSDRSFAKASRAALAEDQRLFRFMPLQKNMSLGTTNTGRALKTAWLVACAAVFVAFLIWKHNGKAQDYLSWTMLVLSFPLGLLATPFIVVTGFLAQMISPLGSLIHDNEYLMVWFWLFVFGYVQWFWLLPLVVRLIKRYFSGQPR